MIFKSILSKIRYLNPNLIPKIGLYAYLKLVLNSFFLVRGYKIKNRYFLFNYLDYQILLNMNFSDIYVFFEIFGNNEYEDIKKFSLKKVNIIDAGANIGLFYSYVKSLEIETPFYLGIEPNPNNLRCLQFNTFGTNTDLISAALWTDNKGVALSDDFSTSVKTISGKSTPSITFIEALKYLPKELSTSSNLLKMDIEGAEYPILEKNSKIISEVFDYLIIEFHGKSKEDLEIYFKSIFKNYIYDINFKDKECALIFAKKRF